MFIIRIYFIKFYFFSTDVYEPFPAMSTSAPQGSTGKDADTVDKDNVSIGGSETDTDDDEFTRLKKIREEERLSR